jgi:hypothetical protein
MTIRKLLLPCLLAAGFLTASTPARADRDAVQFGVNIHVPKGASVKDAVCFFCNVQVDGEVNGDVVVFFGGVHLNGNAHHDVVNFFGEVSAENGVEIGDDLVAFFSMVRLGENVHISKDMVVMFGTIHAPPTLTVGHDHVYFPVFVLLAPLAVLFLICMGIASIFRGWRERRMAMNYPFPPMQ